MFKEKINVSTTHVYKICKNKMYDKNTTKFGGEKWKYTIVRFVSYTLS